MHFSLGVSHFINVPAQWSIGYGQMARAVWFVSVVQVRDAYSSFCSSVETMLVTVTCTEH